MRKLWFVTRPERDPAFHRDALVALAESTQDFTIKWKKNRDAHKAYEATLIKHQLKRDNISNDGSGGRTWAAMLRTFSYVYLDDKGFLKPTKVGRLLLDSKEWEKYKPNIQKQLLALQIPNAYFLSSGFRPKFEDGFKIRPVQFLVRLVNDPEISYYLTKEEITYFCLPAKQDNQLQQVRDQILTFRNATDDDKKTIKIDIANTFDHRDRSDNGARDYNEAHSDVAHTYMMLCDYTDLCVYVRGQSLRALEPAEKRESAVQQLLDFSVQYPFDERYKFDLTTFELHAGLPLGSYKANEYGDKQPASNSSKVIRKANQLLQRHTGLEKKTLDDLYNIFKTEFSDVEARRIADIKYQQFSQENWSTRLTDFAGSYLNDTDRGFEDKTAMLLEAIGFIVDLRPKPVNKKLVTEVEIILHLDDNSICLIDAKNYKDKFALSASLASHMASEYIPEYQGYQGKCVKYFGYVTRNGFSGVKNLTRIVEKAQFHDEKADVTGAMFSAPALLGFLDYCEGNNISTEERMEIFLGLFNNSAYDSVSQMI